MPSTLHTPLSLFPRKWRRTQEEISLRWDPTGEEEEAAGRYRGQKCGILSEMGASWNE